jgi:tetratricopeptide (TPR) repeat protein
MKYLSKYLLALFFAGSLVFAQANPQEQLHSALVLEQQGQFNQVISTLKPLMDSNRLTGYPLSTATMLLGAAYGSLGNFVEAQRSLDSALRLLEHDPQHVTEYATALQKYAGLYCETGHLDAAQSLWLKALKLHQGLGDHTP